MTTDVDRKRPCWSSAEMERPKRTAAHCGSCLRLSGRVFRVRTLEHAQRIAGHASPKTTKLYDRTADTISLDEIERIVI